MRGQDRGRKSQPPLASFLEKNWEAPICSQRPRICCGHQVSSDSRRSWGHTGSGLRLPLMCSGPPLCREPGEGRGPVLPKRRGGGRRRGRGGGRRFADSLLGLAGADRIGDRADRSLTRLRRSRCPAPGRLVTRRSFPLRGGRCGWKPSGVAGWAQGPHLGSGHLEMCLSPLPRLVLPNQKTGRREEGGCCPTSGGGLLVFKHALELSRKGLCDFCKIWDSSALSKLTLCSFHPDSPSSTLCLWVVPTLEGSFQWRYVEVWEGLALCMDTVWYLTNPPLPHEAPQYGAGILQE